LEDLLLKLQRNKERKRQEKGETKEDLRNERMQQGRKENYSKKKVIRNRARDRKKAKGRKKEMRERNF
jgi:hypothetical protein